MSQTEHRDGCGPDPCGIIDRAFEVAAAVVGRAPSDGLAHPFGLNDGRLAWRVSSDVWEQFTDYAKTNGMPIPDPAPSPRVLGWPIAVDETLPSNSMLLEPASQPPSEDRP
jgi:hypothetical protein